MNFTPNKYIVISGDLIGRFEFLKKVNEHTFAYLFHDEMQIDSLKKRYGNIFKKKYRGKRRIYIFTASFQNRTGDYNEKMILKTNPSNQYWAECKLITEERNLTRFKYWRNFLTFFEKFVNNKDFQINRTKFPLKYEIEFEKKGNLGKDKWAVRDFADLVGDYEFEHYSDQKIIVECNFGDPGNTRLTFIKLGDKWFFTEVFFEAGGI
jgi:hypothetical protein